MWSKSANKVSKQGNNTKKRRQEFPSFFKFPKLFFSIDMSPLLDRLLSYLNPIQSFNPYFFNINFNISTFTPTSSRCRPFFSIFTNFIPKFLIHSLWSFTCSALPTIHLITRITFCEVAKTVEIPLHSSSLFFRHIFELKLKYFLSAACSHN